MTYAIEYLNASEKHTYDIKTSKDYDYLVEWGKENIDNFHLDMVIIYKE